MTTPLQSQSDQKTGLAGPSTKAGSFSYLRFAYLISSFGIVLGLWMTIFPSGLWRLLGVDWGDGAVAVLYGAATCAEGVICLLGFFKPQRYIAIFQYLLVYKVLSSLALALHLLLMPHPPLGAWIIVGFWALAAVQAGVVSWGQWKR